MNSRSLVNLIAKFGPFLALLVVWLLFASMRFEKFATWDNHMIMLLQTAVVGTAAVGATLIIIAGGIDLSVGSTIALVTMVVAYLMGATVGDEASLLVNVSPTLWPAVAALAAIGVGAAVGLMIGAVVVGHLAQVAAVLIGLALAFVLAGPLTWAGSVAIGVVAAGLIWWGGRRAIGKLPIAPFIVTLGLWGAIRGVAKMVGDNQPIYPPKPSWVDQLMRHFDLAGIKFPAPGVWLFLLVAAVAAFVLRYTRFGRHIFAIGSNEETARLCGVRIDRTKIVIYILAIACAGLAGLMQFSYLTVGDPTTAEGYELRVIAAVVIGGASLTGGQGSILGTIIGAMIMTVVANGCTKLELDNYIQEIVTGAIIVLAVGVDMLRHRLQK